jgi:hypothetical protein
MNSNFSQNLNHIQLAYDKDDKDPVPVIFSYRIFDKYNVHAVLFSSSLILLMFSMCICFEKIETAVDSLQSEKSLTSLKF